MMDQAASDAQVVIVQYSSLKNMAVIAGQALMTVLGSFASLRALDKMSGLSFGKDIFSVIRESKACLTAYVSVRFAVVVLAWAYICGRFA